MSSWPARVLVLLASLAMPVVAALSQGGVFGPDNATISNRYPTLLVPSGYAFAIWGLIFLLALVLGIYQTQPKLAHDRTLARARPFVLAGYLLTAAWMPVFAQQLFWLSTLVIWASLGCVIRALWIVHEDPQPRPARRLALWLPLSLHAGWLALAAFLQTAQVVVAYDLLSRSAMLPWSVVLFALAAALLGEANRRMRGNVPFVLAAAWGLVGTFREQRHSFEHGADTAAWIALGVAMVLVVQTVWLRLSPAGSIDLPDARADR